LKRRDFLLQGSLLTTSITMRGLLYYPGPQPGDAPVSSFPIFRNPPAIDRPFVRWWWNGDKIEKEEITRELKMLKEAGIGGVEINPIKFPQRTNDLGKKSVKWLSTEWLDLLEFTLLQAASLGLICDLIVGSGWPFGAEWLQGDERSQIVTIAVKKLTGPLDYEISPFELLREADPAITSPFAGRRAELLSLHLVPSPLGELGQARDLGNQLGQESIRFSLPEGNYALYGLVLFTGFMEVINGAPGAGGPVLNHYNKEAVHKYLDNMSSGLGTKKGKIRAFFTDSLELEGANWTDDMAAEFKKRRNYDLLPYLPFILFKVGGMGNVQDFKNGAELDAEFRETLNRVRFDFELTKMELLRERFVEPFLEWCRLNGLRSRVQAYGRGYHPLEGCFGVDIPECETWIKNGLGQEMSETDYQAGRAYSMINKYISSAAHLQGKQRVSCEELTNTDRVFGETLELLKIASDQSIISGATHAVFHGFNYSPKAADFPGWVRYGTFFNEHNPWWSHVDLFTTYRARLAAIFGAADMFADIAILPPLGDEWSLFGAQNEPFPSLMYPEYLTLVWESIHKNGNGCDYVSEKIIQEAALHPGFLQSGSRKYHSLFMIEVESLQPATAAKLHDFILAGGRIFCVQKYPHKSPGLAQFRQRDKEVKDWVEKMQIYPQRFILLKKPDKDYLGWYREIQEKYQLIPYVNIKRPDPFVNQIYYQTRQEDFFFFINSSMDKRFTLDLSFDNRISAGKKSWIWDVETGERFSLPSDSGKLTLDLEPAGSALIVLDHTRKGKKHVSPPYPGENREILSGWTVEWKHINGSTRQTRMNELTDPKNDPDHCGFCGQIIYSAEFQIAQPDKFSFLDLGKVFGSAELTVNGYAYGIQWWGRRVFSLADKLKQGKNTIEITVMTTMVNFLKTLKDNPAAQYWTSEGRKNQPFASMGLLGPVIIY
jgi:hypothetical protein